MSRIVGLKEAINMIWETMTISGEQECNICPYFFIVGAGISTPEIPSARGIINHCKEQLRKMYNGQTELDDIVKQGNEYGENTAKYYSYWFGTAYKNKIHRQQYLKEIINNSKISTSNLLLAQILNSRKIATTVITPNFDNHLLKSLNLMGNYEVLSTNNIADNMALSLTSNNIQILHVHGTYQFYDCKNLDTEIEEVAKAQGIKSTARTIEEFLKNQVPIVIGYSGWEDDVLMTRLCERLKCADLPYNLIWFCYSKKDYDNLPAWIKESDDVVFVSAYIDRAESEDRKEEKEENEIVLPAEDVFSALISKFSIEAPYIFSNPIRYYIEVVDSFLPENIDVFPVESWKRRLDYIEGQYSELDKKIIALDDAAARKDIQNVTEILSDMNMSLISDEDVTHIINGIVKPIISNRNMIEEKEIITGFLKQVIAIIDEKSNLFEKDIFSDYVVLVLECASKYRKIIGNNGELIILDSLINLCKKVDVINPLLFVKLVKSDYVDDAEKLIILKEIISEGNETKHSLNAANAVLSAIDELVEMEEPLDHEILLLMDSIKDEYDNEKCVLDLFYSIKIHMCEKEVYNSDVNIQNIVDDINDCEASAKVLLHARVVECDLTKDLREKIVIAEKAVNEYDIDNINSCMECMDYAHAVFEIINNKIRLSTKIETKYIETAFLLCEKEHKCKYIMEKMIYAINNYLNTIDSVYEKIAHWKRVISISYENELYVDYILSVANLFEVLDESEKDLYIKEFPLHEKTYLANQYNTKAIELYENQKVDECTDLLVKASQLYDEIFKEKYNPALVNICYMIRRGELSKLNINILDSLKKITGMNEDAFLRINEALVYLQNNDWDIALESISKIDNSIDSALEWWGDEKLVGLYEKNQVYLLLLLAERITINDVDDKEKFVKFCNEVMSIPDNYYNKFIHVIENINSSNNNLIA